MQVSTLPNLITTDIALMAEACSGEELLVYVHNTLYTWCKSWLLHIRM